MTDLVLTCRHARFPVPARPDCLVFSNSSDDPVHASQTEAQAQSRPLLQTQGVETGGAVTLGQDLHCCVLLLFNIIVNKTTSILINLLTRTYHPHPPTQ